MEFFDYFERIMICISPIVVAIFAYKSSSNEKQTKKYMEAQEELKKANASIQQKEQENLEKRLKNIDDAIRQINNKINGIDAKMGEITLIDKRIDNLITMSNANFEFCTSLSAVITSIGDALDNDERMDTKKLRSDIEKHKETEREIIKKVCKIAY